jgi:hypothetical protein
MDDDMSLKEWEVARNLIKEFDDRIHDLRKYGFSFLTALFAAESLLIPGYINIRAGQPFIPDFIKLAVMLVTLLMIVALRIMERNYQLFIKCASQRARILERNLNLELTEIISSRHRREKISKYENLIYICFVLGIGGLGSTILFPNYIAMGIMLLFTVVVLFGIKNIKSFDIEYSFKKFTDWTIDRLECKRGDTIRITLTNLDEASSFKIKSGDVAWEIKTQDGCLIHQEKIAKDISIFSDGNYTWLWDTRSVECGIYEVFPHDSNRPLSRKIRVREQDKT